MGIGGHMLGPRKLRRLSTLTGLPLDRAYIRGHHAEGVMRHNGICDHYEIDPQTGEHLLLEGPQHWASCREYLYGENTDG